MQGMQDARSIKQNSFYVSSSPFKIRKCIKDVVAILKSHAHSKGLDLVLEVNGKIPHTI